MRNDILFGFRPPMFCKDGPVRQGSQGGTMYVEISPAQNAHAFLRQAFIVATKARFKVDKIVISGMGEDDFLDQCTDSSVGPIRWRDIPVEFGVATKGDEMMIDKDKQYKLGSKIYTCAGDSWWSTDKDSVKMTTTGMDQLFDDGLLTEVLGMTFIEAFEKMLKGASVARVPWAAGVTIKLDCCPSVLPQVHVAIRFMTNLAPERRMIEWLCTAADLDATDWVLH